MFKLTLSYQ